LFHIISASATTVAGTFLAITHQPLELAVWDLGSLQVSIKTFFRLEFSMGDVTLWACFRLANIESCYINYRNQIIQLFINTSISIQFPKLDLASRVFELLVIPSLQ